MRHISIIEQPSKEAIRAFAEKRNLIEHFSESYTHPQEDYLIASDKLPVFVVADGVTLNFKKLIEDKKKYPNPSPAGEVAKIFCEVVQKSTQSKYTHLDDKTIREIFQEANKAVNNYNNKVGRSDISGNITGFYSATGSFVIIKDDKAYWASICDAFFAHFDKDMNLKFMSTGLCSPYAVINGEERMVDHIERGTIDLQDGDRLFVFTDGFEHYVKNSQFIDFFKNWSDNLENRIKIFSKKMNSDDPENYGHERSFIAILV
jgi:serine/threonine protein phosphatase PrpC